jgi:hypothetical protein
VSTQTSCDRCHRTSTPEQPLAFKQFPCNDVSVVVYLAMGECEKDICVYCWQAAVLALKAWWKKGAK